MSGHSKWASIKHKKGAADAKRGKVFTRLIKELTVAARAGGGDPDMNPRLRTIIADAKASNMPRENIDRAIRRGTGQEPGVSFEEAQYEGYGPGGAALIIDVLTDNKNRTGGEIRHLLEKHGGNLAAPNAVAWMFHKKGYIVVEKSKADEDTLMNAVLDAGADDFQDDEDNWEVFTTPDAFAAVNDAVKQLGIEPASASFPDKLLHIHSQLTALLHDCRPECVAIENLFHAVNVRSALKLGHARGVAMLAAVEAGVPVMEYTPAEIKRAVVGYGRAEKHQVQQMVKLMLGLPAVPSPHDAADALAVPICHLHSQTISAPGRIASAMLARSKATSWRTYRPASARVALRRGKPAR